MRHHVTVEFDLDITDIASARIIAAAEVHDLASAEAEAGGEIVGDPDAVLDSDRVVATLAVKHILTAGLSSVPSAEIRNIKISNEPLHNGGGR